jgi:hypothetical protein
MSSTGRTGIGRALVTWRRNGLPACLNFSRSRIPARRVYRDEPVEALPRVADLCQRIEGAVDGCLGDIGESEFAIAGVGPQPGESLIKVDAGALGEHALGLLDHHPAGQGSGQLLVQALGPGAGTMLRVARSAKVRATMTSASAAWVSTLSYVGRKLHSGPPIPPSSPPWWPGDVMGRSRYLVARGRDARI